MLWYDGFTIKSGFLQEGFAEMSPLSNDPINRDRIGDTDYRCLGYIRGNLQTATHIKHHHHHHHVHLSMVEESLQVRGHVVFHLLQSGPFFSQRTEVTPRNRQRSDLELTEINITVLPVSHEYYTGISWLLLVMSSWSCQTLGFNQAGYVKILEIKV